MLSKTNRKTVSVSNDIESNDDNGQSLEKAAQSLKSFQDKILTALFYGVSSLAVIFINKCILSQYDFPYFNFLATIQFVVTTVILSALILAKKIDVPALNMQIFNEVFPISVMFLGNVISGLGSTKSLNLPMLTVLRRFSILMTMVGEWIILGNKASSPIVISVGLMIGGALIAAVYDFSFSPSGYFLVLLNNLFTALNGIWLKKASQSGKCSKLSVLYYNSLFSAVAMMAFFIAEDVYVTRNGGLGIYSTEIIVENARKALATERRSTLYNVSLYPNWNQSYFVVLFLFASCCGSILNYATFLCTSHNSALTTSVIGCLKNVATSYIGMVFFHDYHFNWLNFVGVNISIGGSLYYTYVTLFKGVAGFGAG